MEFSNHYFAICHLEIYKTKLYNSEKYHFVNHPLVLVYQPTNNSIPNNTPKNEKEFRHHLILCTDKKFLLFTPVFCSRPYAKISSHDGVSQSQDNFWKSGGGNARLENIQRHFETKFDGPLNITVLVSLDPEEGTLKDGFFWFSSHYQQCWKHVHYLPLISVPWISVKLFPVV